MIEAFIDIETPEGSMDAFVVHPAGAKPCPAVIVYMDIWGLREELYDIGRRLAQAGYYCVVPNTYYRQGRVRFEHRNERGEMRSITDLSEDVQENIRVQMRALTEPMIVRDTNTILQFLRNQPVSPGPKGVVGYCMGGRHALSAAGNYPDDFRAAASLHGTRLVTDTPDSPHLLADKFQGEIYCGFAEHDSLAPPATIEALAKLLNGKNGLRYRYEVHAGTHHGYTLPDRDIYDGQAAERDWSYILEMLQRQLSRAD